LRSSLMTFTIIISNEGVFVTEFSIWGY
jgi:hypothetical protein